MRNIPWRIVAWIVARPRVTDWLIERALRTPYYHIRGLDGTLYMRRFWLFNPYPEKNDGAGRKWGDWVPSVRVHHILREDRDRHLHDHPWNARTVVLRGWYREERDWSATDRQQFAKYLPEILEIRPREEFHRQRGYTGRLLFGQYHRISLVPQGGVWTLFITWRKRGTWGFEVEGKKVPWREYLGENA